MNHRERYPENRYQGPVEAGKTVQHYPPGIPDGVMARIVSISNEQPGVITQMQYETPNKNTPNKNNG